MPSNPFPTGWIPDEFDPRDRPLYMAASTGTARSASTKDLPPTASTSAPAPAPAPAPTAVPAPTPTPSAGTGKIVSLRAKCPPIYDQRPLNSCTANAIATALRYAINKTYGNSFDKCDPSRLFIYLNGRRWGADYGKAIDDKDKNTEKDPLWQVQNDYGAHIRKTIDGIRMAGACDEKLWPYPDPEKEPTSDQLYKAPPDAFYNALTYTPRAINYYRIVPPEAWQRALDPQSPDAQRLQSQAMEPPPLADLQKCLDDGWPFIFGTNFYPDADFARTDHIDADGVFVPPPGTEQRVTGRHAILAIGYDSGRRRFLIQNSWGTAEWPFPSGSDVKAKDEKMRGCCWMPYEWFQPGKWKYSRGSLQGQTVTFTSDFWVIKVPEGAPVDKAGARVRAGGEPWFPKPSKP